MLDVLLFHILYSSVIKLNFFPVIDLTIKSIGLETVQVYTILDDVETDFMVTDIKSLCILYRIFATTFMAQFFKMNDLNVFCSEKFSEELKSL